NIVNTYTENGQVAIVTVSGGNGTNGAQNGQTSYQYDAQDRVTKQTNPDGSYLAYGYDANGNIAERSMVAGTVKYSFNANQQLVSVTDTANKTTSYTYDNARRLATTTVPNGITASYGYDANGRLQQVLHQKANGSIVAGSRYTFTSNGQRTKVEEFDAASTITGNIVANPVRTTSYQYDGVNRLTQELVKDRSGTTMRTIDYQYDKVGNRSQKTETTQAGTETTTYVYDSNDRLTQEMKTVGATSTAITYTWDDKGNLLTKTVTGQVTVYAWNADNRLVEVKQGLAQASATTVAKYSYDALGNLVQKTETDKVTTYLTDSAFAYAQTVQESITQGTTAQTVNYVWGNGLIQQSRAGQNSYYHADGLGSIKTLTDETGNATDAYQYDAFGAVVSHTGTTQNTYRYTGEAFDDAINLQYNRARWYDANIGRFISLDKWDGRPKSPVTLNKYLYASSDPTNKRDPSGNADINSQMRALVIGATLTSLAVATYNVLTLRSPTSTTGNRQFEIWDSIAIQQVTAKTQNDEDANSTPTDLTAEIEKEKNDKNPAHHTIPIYLCGGIKQEEYARISFANHVAIHGEIAAIGLAVILGEEYADKVLGYRRKVRVLELAETVEGRTTIANALQAVYAATWWNTGDEPYTIGFAFTASKDNYVTGVNTSLPKCSRTNKPRPD
ncbi:RHS repeat-associated core domain-containing protein, partial [Undibacterium sp. CY18W]